MVRYLRLRWSELTRNLLLCCTASSSRRSAELSWRDSDGQVHCLGPEAAWPRWQKLGGVCVELEGVGEVRCGQDCRACLSSAKALASPRSIAKHVGQGAAMWENHKAHR